MVSIASKIVSCSLLVALVGSVTTTSKAYTFGNSKASSALHKNADGHDYNLFITVISHPADGSSPPPVTYANRDDVAQSLGAPIELRDEGNESDGCAHYIGGGVQYLMTRSGPWQNMKLSDLPGDFSDAFWTVIYREPGNRGASSILLWKAETVPGDNTWHLYGGTGGRWGWAEWYVDYYKSQQYTDTYYDYSI